MEMIQFINMLPDEFCIQKTEITFREKRCVAGMPSVSFMNNAVEHPSENRFLEVGRTPVPGGNSWPSHRTTFLDT